MTNNKATRIERDTLGEIEVPADRYWGAVTQRALNNFPILPEQFRMPTEIIRAYALIKKACAWANHELGVLDKEKAHWIMQVCDEILQGKLDDHFPLPIWQTGSGTHTNMNVNEVIANRAHVLRGGKLTDHPKFLHPNDDVNRSQSSNDTFPTAIHIAAYQRIQDVLTALDRLREAITQKAREFARFVKVGRTHLMDAVPVTLGQEFQGYDAQLSYAQNHLEAALTLLQELPLGGTAVGTGLNTPPGFAEKAISKIAEWTGLPFRPARNRFAGLAGHEPIVAAMGGLRVLAVALFKIANDLRLLNSGPRTAIGEIRLPANEPGSSIMPGKVNPTQPEMMTMLAIQVMAYDQAVAVAASQGHLELNVFKPLIAYNVITAAKLLSKAMDVFREKCIAGIEPVPERMRHHLEQSLMLVTALTPHIGYDKAAEIAKKAFAEHKTLKQSAVELGYLTEEEFDRIVRPEQMAFPHGNQSPE